MKQAGWLLLVVVFLVGSVRADVVITRQTTSDGFMGMGGFSSSETEYFAADRKCTISKKESGGMMGGMPGMGDQMEITRLDKGVNWSVMPENKTYREVPLDSYKKEMEKAARGGAGSMGGMKNMDFEDKYDFSFEISDDGAKQNINGFDCTLMRAVGTGIEKANPENQMTINMEFWLGENVPGFETLKEFNESYMKATGIDQADFSPNMGEALSEFGEEYKKLFEKMKESGSYPIRTVFEISFKGMPGMGDEAMDGMDDVDWSALDKLTEDVDEDDDSPEGKAKREAAEKISGLMSKFGGKKDKAKEDAKEKMSTPKEFSMKTVIEVTSIVEKDVPSKQYEVGSDFSKVSH